MQTPDPVQPPLLEVAEQPVAQRVVRIEKNLNSLGFFSSTASKGARTREKVIVFTRDLPGGVKTEARATILGTSAGLPNTADLDKYLAFQLIVSELRRKQGIVTNPIGFTTYQLLRLLGLKPTGKRYAEVDGWLDRMAGTLIKSEGAVYFARTRRYMRDRFHVFEKVYTVGQEMPNGRKAEQNYVYLSDWQLENLNHGYVLPIALEHYQRLRSDIAKNLVPLLYIWFYASKRPFQKRYQELCQQLNIRVWSQFSRAKEQFSPAIAELQEVGYLSEGELRRTVDNLDFKLVLEAGPIFRDDLARLRQRDDTGQPVLDPVFQARVEALTGRGVTEKAARRLLFGISGDANVEEVIEWVDSMIARDPGKFENPAGMYVSFLKEGVMPPVAFVSSHRRKEHNRLRDDSRSLQAAAEAEELEFEVRYAEYRENEARNYIAALADDARQRLLRDARKAAARLVSHFDVLTTEQQEDMTERVAFKMVIEELPLLNRDEYRQRERSVQLVLPSSEGR